MREKASFAMRGHSAERTVNNMLELVINQRIEQNTG